MDLSNMTPKDKGRYEIMMESRKELLVNYPQLEDGIYMISRNEYKRGKADGINELKQADKLLSSSVQSTSKTGGEE